MAVSGYDGMHLIYEALKKTGGSAEAEPFMSDMKGMTWESHRGPMSIDRATGEVVHNIYIRRVESVGGELRNVEFVTFNNIRGPRVAAKYAAMDVIIVGAGISASRPSLQPLHGRHKSRALQ